MVWKQKPPKPKPRVTILIGILSRQSIVLASDSQTSFGDSKRRDTEKIRVVRFQDNNALVAMAGSSDSSDAVVDTLCRFAAAEKLDDADKVVQMMQRAMAYVRAGFRAYHSNCSSEELLRIFFAEGMNCELMMAFHCGGKPYLYCFDFKTGLYHSAKAIYDSLGIGSPLANYLLSELCSPDMGSRFAVAVAAYVSEKVIENVNACDRPTRLAVLYSINPRYSKPITLRKKSDHSKVFKIPERLQDNVEVVSIKSAAEISAKVLQIGEETRVNRAEKLRQALQSYSFETKNLPEPPEWFARSET